MGLINVSGPRYSPSGGSGETFLWSDPDTWPGNAVPIAGEDVSIPEGMTVILDVVTPSLGELDIDGVLSIPAGGGTYGLTVKSIHLMGTFQIGESVGAPFTGQFTLTFTGIPTGGAHDRGMMLHGTAKLLVYGDAPAIPWTQLNASAAASATALVTKESTGWANGSEIIIVPTDWYPIDATERRTLNSVSGVNLGITAGLTYPKWGVMQYMTDTGPSLTYEAWTTRPTAETPDIIDERAEIGNITRNILFQSINDSHWTSVGFGFHIMVMDLTCEFYIDGVDLLRGGQQGITGRYPVHWHLPSWTKDGVFATMPYLGAYGTDMAVVRRCVVRDCSQRGLVIHSADGVVLDQNILFDIKGHAIFLEDATERHNTITRNLVAKVRSPDPARLLMQHEAPNDGGGEKGPSGLWLTNPDNEVWGNVFADCNGPGMWMSFPTQALNLSGPAPVGLGGGVIMYPNSIPPGDIRDNRSRSNFGPGFSLRNAPNDTLGNTHMPWYWPTVDELPSTGTPGQSIIRFQFPRQQPFKNHRGAYVNRASFPDYPNWTTGGNFGTDFSGATTDFLGGDDARIIGCLIVGTTLNNANPDIPVSTRPWDYLNLPRAGVATYHAGIVVESNALVNFPIDIRVGSYGETYGGGAFLLDDLYIRPWEGGLSRNVNNVLINSSRGYRKPPPTLQGSAIPYNRRFVFAGSVLEPDGRNWVYEIPYLTDGAATSEQVAPAGQNGTLVDGIYYGFEVDYTDWTEWSAYTWAGALRFTKKDSGGATIGDFDIPRGTGGLLAHMRHGAMRKDPGNVYVVEFPGEALSQVVRGAISNLHRVDDEVFVAISFDCSRTITNCHYASGTLSATGTARRTCTAAGSKAAVEAGAGDLYWKDTANNLLYIKFMGGLTYPYVNSVDPQRPHPYTNGPSDDNYISKPVYYEIAS